MSQTPPSMPVAAKKDNTTTCLLVGCGVFTVSVILLIALVVVGGYIFWGIAKNKLVDISTAEPAPVPTAVISDDAYAALKERVEAFGDELKNDTATEPLTLTANELNALIQRDDSGKVKVKGLFITVDEGKLHADFSLPVGEIFPIEELKGRYINGGGSLLVHTTNGKLFAYLDGIEVNGAPLPAQFSEALASENMAEGMMDDPEFKELMGHIASIDVRQDEIVITPKSAVPAETP